MPEPTTTPTRQLPSDGDLELAEYKMGSYLSDLDGFLMALKDASGQSITAEEYLRLSDEGRLDELKTPALDRDQLARIVLFATDALSDAAMIAQEAKELQSLAVAAYHEQADDGRENPDAWAAYQQRIADWHREQAEWREAQRA